MVSSVMVTLLIGGALASASAAAVNPKRLLIVGQGPDGHPPTTHEFMAGANVLAELLKSCGEIQIKVAKADEPWGDGPALIDHADGIAMFVTQGARWMQIDPTRHAALKRLAARGGAIVALHWSVGATNAQYIQGQLELRHLLGDWATTGILNWQSGFPINVVSGEDDSLSGVGADQADVISKPSLTSP